MTRAGRVRGVGVRFKCRSFICSNCPFFAELSNILSFVGVSEAKKAKTYQRLTPTLSLSKKRLLAIRPAVFESTAHKAIYVSPPLETSQHECTPARAHPQSA
jgi:hypothetical protein